MTCFHRRISSLAFVVVTVLLSGQAKSSDETASNEPVNFTGPLLTSNAMPLSPGSLLIEPYLMYYSSDDAYDNQGHRYAKAAGMRQWQTLVPIWYGVTDHLELQISSGAAHSTSSGSHSDGFGTTDTTAGAKYLLLSPDKNGDTPGVSVVYQHRFPTGAYDQLDENPLNATGDGAMVDTFSLMSQQYVWLSNGRPLRFRATVSYSLPPSKVDVNGVSVYGTPKNFHGRERLGSALGISTSVEYSIDAHWALATDLTYNRTSPAQLTGVVGTGESATVFARRDALQSVYSVAPAIEYNFNDRFGLIGGVQISFAGRNNDAFVTPMTAFNMAF